MEHIKTKITDAAIDVGKEYTSQGAGILKAVKLFIYTVIGAIVIASLSFVAYLF